MHVDKLVEQLELYSNAIVGFMVIQSLTFSFTFGTDPTFSGILTREKAVSFFLVVHFALSAILSVLAIQFLSRQIQRLAQGERQLLAILFNAKAFIVFLFAAIPIGMLIYFAF